MSVETLAPLIVKTDAIALRISPFSRTSHVVTWLTPEYGRVTTVVKGACRPKSAFLGQYDLFGTCELLFYRRDHDGLHAIRECTPLRPRDALREDWRRITTASYLCDLLARVAQPALESVALFQLLDETLDELCTRQPDEVLVLRYELALLSHLGLMPQLTPCPTCHAPMPVWLHFAMDSGRFRCRHDRATATHTPHSVTLHRDAVAHLQRLEATLSATPPADLPKIDPHLSLGARRFLGIFLQFHLDIPAAPRRLAFELIGATPALFRGTQGEKT